MLSLRDYGIRFPREATATSPEDAKEIAASFGGRSVALKVKSPQITHKTDIGGVMLNVSGEEAVAQGFLKIMDNVKERSPSATIEGVVVQEMVPSGVEVIIGLTRDPVFGPCIMFGLGGVLTDLFHDVAFRLLPITREEASDMIRSLKSSVLLQGFRGGPEIDLKMVEDLLCRVSEIGWGLRDRLGSIDLNPVVLWENDYCVVDEKILLEEPGAMQVVALRTSHLRRFFEAESVAVVGATESEGKIGRYVMDSLSQHEYRGTVYPVNPGRDTVFGLKSWPSVDSIPGRVDLAVITVPLDLVPAVIRQCASKGSHNMVIVSGGGKEIGGSRADLEREIRELSVELDVRIIGCNCIGVFDGKTRIDTFFQTHERMVRPACGVVSMVTQSGTVGVIFLEEMARLGVARFVSLGNRIDVDEADLVHYFSSDPLTKVIAVYCEGIESGRLLVEAARSCGKPVVMYKAARTKAGSSAAASHTGFYGGSYEVAKGAFEQAGIVLVDSIEELLAASKALGHLPAASGNRIAMISNGAGTTVQALDLIEEYRLAPASLEPGTVRRLREHYPPFYQVGTAVDVTGSATVRDYEVGIEALVSDPNVDIVMPWLVLQDTPLEDSIAGSLIRLVNTSRKPVICGAAGGPYTVNFKKNLEMNGVPLFTTVTEWVTAASCLARAARRQKRACSQFLL